MGAVEDVAELDDFAACGIQRADDIRERFVPTFYFGCEADDRMTAVAFDSRLNHFGAKLNAMFSSDIGHWDVTDMKGVVAQSYGLVQRGLLTHRDYRAFMFANAARLHGGMNPSFFCRHGSRRSRGEGVTRRGRQRRRAMSKARLKNGLPARKVKPPPSRLRTSCCQSADAVASRSGAAVLRRC